MGNTIGRGKTAKVMKINGETMKLKTPIKAIEVTKDHPGHVLLDSDEVKRRGIRAKQLEPQELLKAKKIYFLVELPKSPNEEKNPITRRVRSGIHLSAKDRLEYLMLSRRTVSDIAGFESGLDDRPGGGPVQVKMRVPKAHLEKLVEESRDGAEVAEKIIGLYMGNSGEITGDGRRRRRDMNNPRERRVSFVPNGGEISLAATSN